MSEKAILTEWNKFRKITTDKITKNNRKGGEIKRLFTGQCKYCKSIDLVEQGKNIHCPECGRIQ